MIGVLLLLAAASRHATPTDPVAAAVRAAHAAHARKAKDPFAPSPRQPSVGERFKVTVKPFDGEHTTGVNTHAMWTYRDGRLTFRMDTEDSPKNYGGTPVERVFYYAARLAPGGAFVGQNAYGARRRVTIENWYLDGISAVSSPEYAPGYQVEIAGPAAKALAAAARFVIEGETVVGKSGHVLDCEDYFIGATIDGPYEITTFNCWANARISRIALIDSRNGAVLREWTDPAR